MGGTVDALVANGQANVVCTGQTVMREVDLVAVFFGGIACKLSKGYALIVDVQDVVGFGGNRKKCRFPIPIVFRFKIGVFVFLRTVIDPYPFCFAGNHSDSPLRGNSIYCIAFARVVPSPR